jgi:putative transposase
MPAEGERQRSAQGSPRVNPKRAYRVMAQAGQLLPKTPRRRPSSRKHEGTVTVGRCNGRWCCDGLEIRCDSGQTVTATFAKDCGDREVFAWRAWEGTRALARALGLKPINTPVCSPQSNGIAEHFNEVHPHSSLKMRSPLGFRRHQAAQARC